MTYSENRVKKIKKTALINEKLVAEAVKKYGKDVDGYKVIQYADIAKRLNKNPVVVRDACLRLQERGEIEIKKSFAMFGSVKVQGIRFTREENA